MKFFLWVTLMALSLGVQSMKKEVATLAGGCFWGMEDIIRAIPGVQETTVGYTGGIINDPTYNIVKLGTSNHAESVQVVFDPDRLSFADLLGYFFRMHDPTTLNQQGNDKGTQYRSVIFYHSPEQKETAEAKIKMINETKKWPRPIVTQLVSASKFYPAEDYHQDYLKKNPGGYTCHWLRD
jgi:methionine-S-sulfoxide reductase